MKKIMAMIVALAFAFVGLVGAAHATDGSTNDEPCVPSEAWTETIEHPEVTEEVFHEAVTDVIHHPEVPAVTETIPGIWANWSPNNTKGPQDYTPIWPEDERGTWHVHGDVPPGHAGPDGVYQQGGGNSPYFYRQAEKVNVITPAVPAWDEEVVIEEAYTETVVVEEAWTETIEHEAVTCDEPTEEPTPTGEPCPDDSLIANPETGECEPTEPPTDEPTPTDEPAPTDEPTPTDNPTPTEPNVPVDNDPEVPVDSDEPKGTSETYCLADSLVTKTYDAEGNTVSTSTVNGHPKCDTGEVIKEEGL